MESDPAPSASLKPWPAFRMPTSVAANGVLALVYLASGKIGLTMAHLHESASPVWPPTGVALAALMLLGPRLWPGIWLGAFLVNVLTPVSVAAAIGIACGNTLEALAAARLADRLAGGRLAFETPGGVWSFVLVAAPIGTAVSPTIGVLSLALSGFADWSGAPAIWATWWLGDLVGAITLAPLIVIWASGPAVRVNRRRLAEALALLVLVAGMGVLVFVGTLPWGWQTVVRPFMAIPPLLWAAVRFGPRGAITGVCLTSCIALWGALHGKGPFILEQTNTTLLLLQVFVWTITVTLLVLAAAVAERRRVKVELEAWHVDLQAQCEMRTMDLALAHRALREEARERRELEASLTDVIDRERFRLAAELHDGLGQRLTGISLSLAGLRGRLQLDPERARDLEDLEEQVGGCIAEAGSLASGVCPVDLEVFGLRHALENLAASAGRSFGVTCALEADGEKWDEARGPAALQMYRIAQEALHNAVRQGKARRIQIRLAATGSEMTLAVSDDGVGLPPDHASKGGMGLRIMRHRARMMGGRLEVRNQPHGGAVVTCDVPASRLTEAVAAKSADDPSMKS